MLAVRPGKMGVALQHHRKTVIISRNSHGSQHSCFWEVPWETQGLKSFLFCRGSCSLLVQFYLPITFYLWGEKKVILFLPVLSGISAAGDLPKLVPTSADSEHFLCQIKALPVLTKVIRNFAASFTWTNTWFPAQKGCEAGVLSNGCTQQSCFQRSLIHPCRSLQLVSN